MVQQYTRTAIVLTGKETKQEIVLLLVAVKPEFERLSTWDTAHHYRNYKKPELLKLVKIYNTNLQAGGTGNISRWDNVEAFSYTNEVNRRVKDYLATRGVTDENMRDCATEKAADHARQMYVACIETEFGGLIGANEVEAAYEKLKSIFDGFMTYPLPINTIPIHDTATL